MEIISLIALSYLVRQPLVKTEEKPPLVILLHGVGSNEQNMFPLAQHLPDECLVISARAPIALGPKAYGFYRVDFSTGKPVFNAKEEVASRQKLIDFVDDIVEKYDADPQQVYLLGFSQGAIMSFSVLLTASDKIRGIIAIGGRILDEVKNGSISAKALKNKRVLILHGKEDQKLPLFYARESKAFLEKLPVQLQYQEYANTGHEITPDMILVIKNWLAKQQK